MPIGYLAAGFAADHVGIRGVGVALAGLALVVASVPLASPEVRNLSIKHAGSTE